MLCLPVQEEQEWLQLMRETEDTAEEAGPARAARDDIHGPGAASAGGDVAEPSSMTSQPTAPTSGL